MKKLCKDMFDNEISVGDFLIYFTVRSSIINPNVCFVTNVDNKKYKVAAIKLSENSNLEYDEIIKDYKLKDYNNLKFKKITLSEIYRTLIISEEYIKNNELYKNLIFKRDEILFNGNK